MSFTEIVAIPSADSSSSSSSSSSSLFIPALAAQVEPQLCGPLIRQLQSQSDTLQHLKRVKIVSSTTTTTTTATSNTTTLEKNDPDYNTVTKRQKRNEQRLILLGTTIDHDPETIQRWHKQYIVQQVQIPKRPPNSEEEWKIMNECWPTKKVNYLAIQQEQEAKRISVEEWNQMETIIQQVFLENDTVLVNPSSQTIVGRASVERSLQLGTEKQQRPQQESTNPLQTNIIYAIQNVSRRERTQPDGSYLCTGLDLYTVHEPSLFEGMAALHSRVRRIIFVHPSLKNGALTHYSLHTLSSTNHHFRAFQWNGRPKKE